MHDYHKIIEELKSKAGVPADDIFEFDNSNLKDIFLNYFEYCQENLINHCTKYSIQPARFYYRNYYEINARAGISNGYFIIGVNMGTVQEIYSLFYDNNNIFEQDENLSPTFGTLGTVINIPLGFFMFQLATLFTYHHELAHLIQKSDILKTGITEQYVYQANPEFSIERHILEFDADLHGANATCTQILVQFKLLSIENQTEENLAKLLSMGIASIFSYFLLFFNDSEKIYYKEYTHPHPIVRISYVLDCFIRVAQENLPINNKIRPEPLLKLCFIISDIFFKTTLEKDAVKSFRIHLLNESFIIENYVNELLSTSKEMKNLVMNRV